MEHLHKTALLFFSLPASKECDFKERHLRVHLPPWFHTPHFMRLLQDEEHRVLLAALLYGLVVILMSAAVALISTGIPFPPWSGLSARF